MTIGKNILAMSPDELAQFVTVLRRSREVTPNRKPKRNTLKALAKAWNIPEGAIEAAIKEQLELFPEKYETKTTNTQETQCPRRSKKHSKGSTTKT